MISDDKLMSLRALVVFLNIFWRAYNEKKIEPRDF